MQNGSNNGNRVQGHSKGTGTKSRQQGSNALPQFRFIRCELQSHHKSDLVQGISDGSLTMDMCFGLVERGYKLSLTNDTKNRTFIATITDTREGSPTRNMALSARGATIATACCALAYKHFFILLENWLENEPQQSTDEWSLG